MNTAAKRAEAAVGSILELLVSVEIFVGHEHMLPSSRALRLANAPLFLTLRCFSDARLSAWYVNNGPRISSKERIDE